MLAVSPPWSRVLPGASPQPPAGVVVCVRHALAAAIFITAWGAVLLTSLNDEGDAITLPLVVGASVAAGLLSGSWWSIGLAALLLPLAATQTCEPGGAYSCETEPVFLAIFIWAPASAAMIAAGVAAVRGVAYLRRGDDGRAVR